MARGRGKWFNEKKGYGFIARNDGDDVFVHYSDLKKSGFKTLHEGDEVEFELYQHEKGLKAINIMVLE